MVRRAIIDQYTKEELKTIIEESSSYADVARALKLAIAGTTYRRIKKRLQDDRIDTSHFFRAELARII